MKKIAFYIDSLSIGGAERVTIYLARYMKSRNIDVEIITSHIQTKEYDNHSIPRFSLFQLDENKSQPKLIYRLRQHFKKTKPDLIISMGTSFLPYVLLASFGLKIKIIVSERNSPQNFSGRNLTKIITEKLFRFADGYVFQTQGAADYYRWIQMNKIIIANPLFVDELPKNIEKTRKKEIVSVGRLHKQKNQRMLIKAFSLIKRKHADYKLIIYGEGNERQELENLIKELGLQDCVFLPGTTSNVLEEIKNSSIFAFSSDFEGMPNALIEAMALGLPVVSTDCQSGGPRELITHQVNGLLAPVGNIEQFSKELDYLLLNPKKAEELAKNAKKIRNKLEAEKIGRKWLDFSLDIIKK